MLGIWVLSVFIGTYIGIQKGYGGLVSFLAGLLLGPASLLMIFVSTTVKKCPKCAEPVKKEAMVCKHCQFEFADSVQGKRK